MPRTPRTDPVGTTRRPLPRTIRTERLLLRQWQRSDREPFAAINADPTVMEHFPTTLRPDESDTLFEAFQAHWAEHGFGRYAVELPGDAPLIGFVGLMVPSFDAPFLPAVEIAWRLAPQAWWKGFATEAARAVARAAHDNLALPEIISITTTTNRRSMAVMERLRMSRNPAEDFDHPLLPTWPNRRQCCTEAGPNRCCNQSRHQARLDHDGPAADGAPRESESK